nr:translation initiation factor IF-2-like [Pan troglodytes]
MPPSHLSLAPPHLPPTNQGSSCTASLSRPHLRYRPRGRGKKTPTGRTALRPSHHHCGKQAPPPEGSRARRRREADGTPQEGAFSQPPDPAQEAQGSREPHSTVATGIALVSTLLDLPWQSPRLSALMPPVCCGGPRPVRKARRPRSSPSDPGPQDGGTNAAARAAPTPAPKRHQPSTAWPPLCPLSDWAAGGQVPCPPARPATRVAGLPRGLGLAARRPLWPRAVVTPRSRGQGRRTHLTAAQPRARTAA